MTGRHEGGWCDRREAWLPGDGAADRAAVQGLPAGCAPDASDRGLLGLGRAQCGPPRILCRTVTAQDDDARMRPEPGGKRIGRTIGQEVDRLMALQVDQQGAIGASPTDAQSLRQGWVAPPWAAPAAGARAAAGCSGLVDIWSVARSRAPASPPSASPSCCNAVVKRTVRCAVGGPICGRRSVKVCVGYGAFTQRKRRTYRTKRRYTPIAEGRADGACSSYGCAVKIPHSAGNWPWVRWTCGNREGTVALAHRCDLASRSRNSRRG